MPYACKDVSETGLSLTGLQYHDPALRDVEQDLLDHWKNFLRFCNHVCHQDPDAGKKLYDLHEITDFDIMGTLHRPGFVKHYDNITPYLGNAKVWTADMEITAVTPEFGYVTCLQKFVGTSSDGIPFEFVFRGTSILRKVGGEWKYVHEHFSFPVDMATKVADPTCGQKLEESIRLEK